MKKQPLILLTLLFIVCLGLSCLLTACGGATATPAPAATSAAYPTSAAAAATTAPAARATTAPAAAATTAPAAATISASSAASSGSGYNVPSSENSPDRLVIRNATVTLVSEDVEKTLGQVRSLAIEQQGIVSSSNTALKGDYTYATIVIQVPSVIYDMTMGRLRQFAYKVENENSTSQDVTEEFVDTESQVRNLKATEAQLLELLKKANTVQETLVVQRELTAVRGEIERRQGRVNFLQRKSDFSTITITIAPRILPAPVEPPKPAPGWTFDQAADRAWNRATGVLRFVATLGINILINLIWLGPLALMLGIGAWFGWRKLRRRVRLDKIG